MEWEDCSILLPLQISKHKNYDTLRSKYLQFIPEIVYASTLYVKWWLNKFTDNLVSNHFSFSFKADDNKQNRN